MTHPAASAARARRVVAGAVAAAGWLALSASAARAHGTVDVGPPDAAGLILGWTIEPFVAIPLLAAGGLWLRAVRRVNARHPDHPVPRVRTWAFLGGLAAIAIALMSGIDRYDTILFSVHMIQHILLTLVGPPLIVLAAPVTLVLRLAAAETRRRWILPVLHSRLVRGLSFPPVAWLLFAGVMWSTHFSGVFDRALEDPAVHDLEHATYLGSALLFWWPAVGLDPGPWRMSHPVRAMYVFLQMPQNTFLAVAIQSAAAPLYTHYATLVRPWGPTPLMDQQFAGGIMWLVGDLIFLTAVLGLVAAWIRHEDRATARADRRADAERVAIRAREARLAERVAGERPGGRGA